MTRYDGPPASDGHGGSHPLAGVPQEVLDAARAVLADAAVWKDVDQDPDVHEAIADAVVMALRPWLAFVVELEDP